MELTIVDIILLFIQSWLGRTCFFSAGLETRTTTTYSQTSNIEAPRIFVNDDHGDVFPLFSGQRWLFGSLEEPPAWKL